MGSLSLGLEPLTLSEYSQLELCGYLYSEVYSEVPAQLTDGAPVSVL